MDSKRFDYIDLAKGIGILSIVAMHIGALPTWLPKLSASWVPLFFILSGMFFKPSQSLRALFIKKTNTILIPFLFFYIVSYLIFYILELILPGVVKTDAKGILDLFYQEGYFNGPIWFLLSLFWDFVIMWFIANKIGSRLNQTFIVLLVGCIGVSLGVFRVFIPFKLAQSFTALPFFYFGYLISIYKPISSLNRKYAFLLSIGLFSFSVALSLLFGPAHLEPSLNSFTGNVIIACIIIFTFSMAIILLCRTIKWLPIINYIGRYSLIPLCLHHLVYRPILLIFSKLPPPPLRVSH